MSDFGDFAKHFNWRFMVIRLLVNAMTLLLIALITPKIYFVDRSILNLFFMALALGLLNIIIKPIVQFLTLPYIFASYGLILALVNALLLLLLAFFFPQRFAVDSVLWVIVAGALMGIVSSLMESLLGLSMPILPDEPEDLRQYVEEQRPSLVSRLLDAESDMGSHELAEAQEPPALADSESEISELPPPTSESQPERAVISSTADPASAMEPPAQDPVEMDESDATPESVDNISRGAESAFSAESTDESGDEAVAANTPDNETKPGSTSQAGTQGAER